jgi:hypothetical protein
MKSIAQAFRNALTSLKGLDVLLLLGGMLTVGILFAASETVTFVFSRSQSVVTTNTSAQARIFRLTGVGALLAAAGVSTCQFLEDGSATRRSLLFLYASAFLVSACVLLFHLFGVSGANGLMW